MYFGEAYARDAEDAIGFERIEKFGGAEVKAPRDGAGFFIIADERIGGLRIHAAAETRGEARAVEFRDAAIHRREQFPFIEGRADHYRDIRGRTIGHHLDRCARHHRSIDDRLIRHAEFRVGSFAIGHQRALQNCSGVSARIASAFEAPSFDMMRSALRLARSRAAPV